MIFKNFQDIKLSTLGFGAMRLPVIDGRDAEIDVPKTEKMVEYAMQKGINYYDTAWGYHEGNSELVMGKVLSKYPRDSFYLASKFPGYDISNMPKVKEIFEKQLEKCRVEYFDFYLFHNVCEMNIDSYLDDEKYGIYTYLMAQKKNGRIKHLGFSTHGSLDVMKRFLKAYGKDMEFCQIQLNYFDWKFQDAKAKVELLKEYNIPIWVMEPIRGGKLASLNEKQTNMLAKYRPDANAVDWAFSFLQGIDGVTVTLSGMSNFEQLKQNIETFSNPSPLNAQEKDALLSIAEDMIKSVALPCTACRYCTTHCPMELDIPSLLALYNEHLTTKGGFGFIAPMALSTYDSSKLPSACIGCRSCEAVCPQNIKISEALADFSSML